MTDEAFPDSDRLPFDLGITTEAFESEFTIVDERAALRPSEHVQRQFIKFTRDLPIAVSSLQTRRTARR